MFNTKPRPMRRIRRAEDLLATDSIFNFNLFVSLDIQLPLRFYCIEPIYSSDYHILEILNISVYRKSYEIFTNGLQAIQFRRQYSARLILSGEWPRRRFLSRRVTTKISARLQINEEKKAYSATIFETKRCGELQFEGNANKIIKTSVSLAIAPGFIKEKLQENPGLILKGYVNDEDITVPYGQTKSFIAEFENLFHVCKGSNSSHSVPYSQVCDGLKNCESGSDELDCQRSGYPICSREEFSCASRDCVAPNTRCDLIKDCHDGSDEESCEKSCQHRECHNGRCLPKSSFHDGEVDCSDSSDESASRREPCVLICNRTECVTKEMLNNSCVDCKGPEGPIDETLGALEAFECPQKGNRSFINNWAPRCVLAHDNFQEIIGCRDFSNLDSCDDFACPPGYAKCPQSFCIPIAYLNDGKEDCDYGEDEGPQRLQNSSELFLCHPQRSQYVSLSSVCDGRKDCSHGEDEVDCNWTCHPGFICLAGAISAVRYRKSQPPSDWSFINPKTRYVHISGLHVPDFFKVYPHQHFKYLMLLNMSWCGIDNVNLFNKSDSQDFVALRTFDLSHNNIANIEHRSIFNILYHLKKLDLSHNENLNRIDSFFRMKCLEYIDLSFTNINQFPKNIFSPLESLQTLSLKRTRVAAIDFILPANLAYFNIEQTNILSVAGDVFKRTRASPSKIYSSSFKICCPRILGPPIAGHFCRSPETEVIFSCEDLVEETLLRLMLWFVGLATLVGNIITLVYRLTWERKLLQKSYGLFVTNLGVSDTLMGCYLAIIIVADLKFQGEYVLHDHTWRTSDVCRSAGTIATLSSITSTFFIFLITIDRFLAVRFPFGEIRFNKQTVAWAVSGTWMLGTSLALLPLLPFAESWEIYSGNGMCLGLPLKRERLPGWQYSVFLFVGLNFVVFVLIGAGQLAIFMAVRKSKRQTTKSLNPQSQLFQNQRREEIAIAKKLALVVISNFICWFPIVTMGILTLFGINVGAAAFRWSAVMVLPVNSALNPLLYTLPAFKQKLTAYFRIVKTRHVARAVAKISRKPDASHASLKSSWHTKIQKLKTFRQKLNDLENYDTCTLSQLKLVYQKVKDVRSAC